MNTQTNSTHTMTSLHRQRFSLLSLVSRVAATYRQRQALARLDRDALKDIGITGTMADAEASRPLWDVPANWLR